jgi:hypothetical protein
MSLSSYARAIAAEAADALTDLTEDALNPHRYGSGSGYKDSYDDGLTDYDAELTSSPRTARSRLSRRVSMTNGSSSLSKKIRLDGKLSEGDIVATLQEAKKFPHLNSLTLDEVVFTADISAAVIDLLKHSVLWASLSMARRGSTAHLLDYSSTSGNTASHSHSNGGRSGRRGSLGGDIPDASAGTGLWDRLNLEFCEGPSIYVQMVIQAALVLDCVKHLFVASDDKKMVNEWLCGPLETSLRCNVNMTSLWLLVPMTEPLAKSLGHGLAYNTCLEKLSLSGSTWDYKAPAALVDGTQTTTTTNTSTRGGSSKRQPSPSPGREKDGTLVKYNPPLTNPVAVTTTTTITPGLSQNETLRTLDLSCCSLDDESLATIIFGLEQHAGLHYLDLSRNFSRYRTMTALGQLLRAGMCPLKTLDLREQTKRGNLKDVLDISLLCQGFTAANDRLEKLKLSYNNLNDAQVVTLGRALQYNSSLQELDLQWNQISDQGVKLFTTALSDISGLRKLLLGGNAFGEEGHTVLDKLPDDDDSIVTVKESGVIRGGENDTTDDDDDTSSSGEDDDDETDSSEDANGNATTDDDDDDDDEGFYSIIDEGDEEDDEAEEENSKPPAQSTSLKSPQQYSGGGGRRMPASFADAFDSEESSPGAAIIGDL